MPSDASKLFPKLVFGHTPLTFPWVVSRSSTRRTQCTKPVLLKEMYSEEIHAKGLTRGCLAKGKKVVTGGEVAKVMVAIYKFRKRSSNL